LSNKRCSISLEFSLYFRENFLVSLKKKYLGLIIYFPLSSFNQTHFNKIFIPIFSPKFSIHHISHPNKQTLNISPNKINNKFPDPWYTHYNLLLMKTKNANGSISFVMGWLDASFFLLQNKFEKIFSFTHYFTQYS